MCASGLTALPREVAAGSVVLELTDDHVLLRARSRMLLTPDVVHLIEAAMKRLKGEHFQVKFDEQEHDGNPMRRSRFGRNPSDGPRVWQ